MTNIRGLVNGLVQVADIASGLIPGAGLISKGIELGEKVIDIFDTLGDDIPLDQQSAAQDARAKLAAAVKDKAAATSKRLRGE